MRNRNFRNWGLCGALVLAVLPAWAGAGAELKDLGAIKQLETKVEAMAAKARPAVVALISEKTQATGSGVVSSADGLILTAAHVIQGVKEVEVVFPDGRQFKGKVLGANFSKDIAMVRMVGEGQWPYAEVGSSKDLKAGDWVVAMGHSSGFDPSRPPPVRFGRVISTGPGTFFTTDCKLIGGDSGGPIFDLEGRIIGINSSIGQSLKNNNHGGIQGFHEDWQKLLEGRTWGQLTLNPFSNPETPVLGIGMGLTRAGQGVAVDSIVQGSPAAAAGVRVGDVIRTLDGEAVEDAAQLLQMMAKLSGGDRVKLGVRRENQDLEVEVTLKKYCELYRQGPKPVPMGLEGDSEVPLMTSAEREVVNAQNKRFNELITPALAAAAKSTVRIWKGEQDTRLVSYGTVIGDGTRILSKWSEVEQGRGVLLIEDDQGEPKRARLVRVYPEEDLAVLQLEQGKLTPVVWSDKPVRLGSFLAAMQPGGRMAGFGVLAVEERSLRDSDKGFLGVVSDPKYEGKGVRVLDIFDNSGAADAGLRVGDVILEIGKRPVSGVIEMQKILRTLDPGTSVVIRYKRGEEVDKVNVVIGSLPEMYKMVSRRQMMMESLGTDISEVRDTFPSAIQTDMSIQPDQMGGPVVNLDGDVVGIMLARADRTRSFMISTASLRRLLESEGLEPQQARAELAKQQQDDYRERLALMKEQQKREVAPRRQQRKQISPERLQMHLDEMRRLMDFLQGELDGAEGRQGP